MKPPIFDERWSEEIKELYRHDMQEMWDASINPHMWNQYHNQLDALFRTGWIHERRKVQRKFLM